MGLSRAAFVAGARDIALLLPGTTSVAVIASAAGVGAGLSAVQAYVMVGITFAGASQLAALELMQAGAAVAVILVTALLINARFAVFSASLGPHFRDQPPRWRWALGAVLSTPAAVLTLTRGAGTGASGEKTDDENGDDRDGDPGEDDSHAGEGAESRAEEGDAGGAGDHAGGDESGADLRSYYLGAAVPLWATWQVGALLGILLGARLPPWLELDFVVPLVFVGLLFSTVGDRATAVAAAVGGPVAVLGAGPPLDFGFVAGTAAGVAAGALAERGWD